MLTDFSFFNFLKIDLFYLFLAALVRGLSLVAVTGGGGGVGGYSSLQCAGFSLRWPLLLQHTALGAQAQ